MPVSSPQQKLVEFYVQDFPVMSTFVVYKEKNLEVCKMKLADLPAVIQLCLQNLSLQRRPSRTQRNQYPWSLQEWQVRVGDWLDLDWTGRFLSGMLDSWKITGEAIWEEEAVLFFFLNHLSRDLHAVVFEGSLKKKKKHFLLIMQHLKLKNSSKINENQAGFLPWSSQRSKSFEFAHRP